MARHRLPTVGDVVLFEGQVVVLKQDESSLMGVSVDDAWRKKIAADFSGAALLATSVRDYAFSVGDHIE